MRLRNSQWNNKLLFCLTNKLPRYEKIGRSAEIILTEIIIEVAPQATPVAPVAAPVAKTPSKASNANAIAAISILSSVLIACSILIA